VQEPEAGHFGYTVAILPLPRLWKAFLRTPLQITLMVSFSQMITSMLNHVKNAVVKIDVYKTVQGEAYDPGIRLRLYFFIGWFRIHQPSRCQKGAEKIMVSLLNEKRGGNACGKGSPIRIWPFEDLCRWLFVASWAMPTPANRSVYHCYWKPIRINTLCATDCGKPWAGRCAPNPGWAVDNVIQSDAALNQVIPEAP